MFCIILHAIYTLPSDSQVGTTKSWSSATRVISDDSLNSGVKSWTEQEQSAYHYKDVNDSHYRPAHAGKQFSLVKLPVRDSEVDETEEGIEGRTKKGEEISHARNNLGEDESDSPDSGHDRNPNTPSNDGVAVRMSRLPHNSEVDEFGTYVRVDDTDDDGGNDDEREGTLFVGDDTQTTESWGGGVLAQVSESNCWRNNKQEGGNGNKDSEGFGEVLWSFHLGDEGREKNLRNPEKSDVQDGVHAINPGGAGQRKGVSPNQSIGRVVTVVSDKRSFLDTGKDEEEKDSDSHASS